MFSASTPDSVIAHAKNTCIENGGHITHEYTIITGFSARGPESAYRSLEVFKQEVEGAAYTVNVEMDQQVTAFGAGAPAAEATAVR